MPRQPRQGVRARGRTGGELVLGQTVEGARDRLGHAGERFGEEFRWGHGADATRAQRAVAAR